MSQTRSQTSIMLPIHMSKPTYGSLTAPTTDQEETDMVVQNEEVLTCRYKHKRLIFGAFMIAVMVVGLERHGPRTLKGTELLAKIMTSDLLALHSTTRANRKCIFTDVRCNAGSGMCYVAPTEYEVCMQSINLNVDHFVQTVHNLDRIFQQFYPFYYTALDPEKTEPRNYQSELGYCLYNDSKVDIHGRLEYIQQQAIKNGRATMANFWDVAEVFQSLRDAHVGALRGNIGNLTSDFFSGRYDLVVFPKQNWESIQHSKGNAEDLLLWRTIFHYQNETLHLDLEQYSSDGNRIDVRRVTRIDGLSPMNFLLRLAKTPLASIAYKSIGPRVNSLTYRNFPSVNPAPTFFRIRKGRKEQVVPSHILPDSFLVEYKDRSRETFYSRILMMKIDFEEVPKPSINFEGNCLSINITGIEKIANQPSCLHRNFHLGIGKANKLASFGHGRILNAETTFDNAFGFSVGSKGTHNANTTPELFCDVHQDGWFTKAYNCSGFSAPYNDDGPFEAAYKVMDEGYIVFKLDSFDAPPNIIFPLWREVNEAAVRAGVSRLMIDISNNGGGEVPMGLHLARLMYPEVSCEMFDNKYDMVYNEPMRVWARVVQPLLTDIENDWFHALSENDKLNILTGVTRVQREDMANIADAMCTFVLDHDANFCGAVRPARKRCILHIAAKTFHTSPSLESFTQFVQEFFPFMKESNPWTIASEFDVKMSLKKQSFVRGGVLANFTSFLKHEPDYPSWWRCSPCNEVNVFSEYILIGNGNSGSTANTFQTTVEQIWKNKQASGAMRPLTTISYGGVTSDTPLTQFAGGTVEDRVNVEDPFVGLAGLCLLARFFHGSSRGRQVTEAFNILRDSLPEVPYYLMQFPRLPAVEIYNKFMLSNGAAMPLEFVFMPPDIYLPQMGYAGVFNNPAGMAYLYDVASQEFGRRR